jgi:hypothetical protein
MERLHLHGQTRKEKYVFWLGLGCFVVYLATCIVGAEMQRAKIPVPAWLNLLCCFAPLVGGAILWRWWKLRGSNHRHRAALANCDGARAAARVALPFLPPPAIPATSQSKTSRDKASKIVQGKFR